MKRFGQFVSKLAACGVAWAVASMVLPAQAAQQEGVARVAAIRNGTAQYATDASNWKNLKVGDKLKAGATIKTDTMAVVDLFLKDNGPVVRVTPDTTLALTTLNFEKTSDEVIINTELGLSSGRILGKVKTLAAASKYEVRTPVGTCGIRGTIYDISADGKITVIEGTVVVRYISQPGVAVVTFVVQAGQQFDPTANGGLGNIITAPAGTVEGIRIQTDEAMSVVVVAAPPTTPGAPPSNPPTQEPTTETVPSGSGSHSPGQPE